MKITFVSDQFYPRTSADSEQIISSLTALTNFAEITLLSAKYLINKPVTKETLHAYYGKESNFNLTFINHVIPNLRGVEKLIFAVRAVLKVKKNDCELIYTRNIPVVISALFFTSLPIVFETYRPWPNQNMFSKLLFTKLSKMKRIAGIVLHSEFAKKSFLEVGFSESKLLVAHNAFDLKDYETINLEEVRKEHSLPTDKLITTYSGRVNKQKGLLRLLKLADHFKETLFLIVGSEGKGEIEKEAEKYNNVKILSWMDKKTVFSILQASDILYIPPTLIAREVSRNTVLPLKTFIYKAAGKAIIGPDADDICEVLTHSKSALLVEPDNDEKEIEAFSLLLNDEKLRNRLGSTAKEEIKNMTWENRAESIHRFIKKKLEG